MKPLALLSIVAATIGLSYASLHDGMFDPQTRAHIGPSASASPQPPGSARRISGLPIYFEPNQGQIAAQYDFVARAPGYRIGIDATGVEIHKQGASADLSADGPGHQDARPADAMRDRSRVAIRLQPVNARPDARLIGEAKQQGVSHYLASTDAAKKLRNIPHYGQLRFRQIYDGIDWVFYGNPEQAEYDFIVAPHARPEQIRLAINGAKDLKLTEDGALVAHVAGGEFRHQKPVAYQTTSSGERRPVDVTYTLSQHEPAKPAEIAFAVGDYDRSRPLTIDPVLTYSTYLGGTGDDTVTSFTVAADESVYIAGTTQSVDFPRQTADHAPPQAYVAKFNAAGTALEYVAFLGDTSGPAAVRATAIGDVFVAGAGRIPGNTTNSACTDGYAATLTNNGTVLVNARCLPSAIADMTNGERSALTEPGRIRLDSNGVIYRPERFERALPDDTDDDNLPTRAGFFEFSLVSITRENTISSRRVVGTARYGLNRRPRAEIESFSVTDDGSVVATFAVCTSTDQESSGGTSALLFSSSGALERRFSYSLLLRDCFIPTNHHSTTVSSSGIRYFAVAIDDLVFASPDDVINETAIRIFDENGRKVGEDINAVQPPFGRNSLNFFAVNDRGSLIVSERNSGTSGGANIRKLDPDRTKFGTPHEFVVHEEILTDSTPVFQSFGSDSLLVVETTASTRSRIGLQTAVAGGTDAAISRYELSGCIENNGLLSLDQANVAVAENGAEITVGVTRSMVTDSQCSAHVRYQTNASTAAAGPDFANTSGILRWAPGENGTKVIRIPIANDSVYELTEAFNVSLSEPVGSTLGANSSATVSITDDDPMPSVGLTISASSIPELGGMATLTARLSAIAGTPVTVPLVFSGTATFGSDYQAPTQIVIPAGSRFVDVQVRSIDNTLPEPDETATISIGRPVSATLGSRTTATFTIVDNDRAPGVTTSPTSLAFGNQAVGSTSAAQTLTLTNSGTDPLTISFIGASGDFIASPSCPMVLAASASCSIAVQFRPSLTGPRAGALTILSNAPTSPNSVQLTGTGIQGRPTLSISDVSIAEGNTGTKSASLTVSLSAAAREPVNVKVRTRNGTAIAGSDYVAAGATLTIPVGRTSTALSVTVNGDSTFEPDEFFYVDLTEPVAAVIGDGEGSITILNDDTAPGTPGISVPTRSFNFGNVRVGSSSAQRTLTITSSGTAPLMIRSVRVTGDFVGTSNCPASLAPGATCALTGTFKPAATGLRTGTVTITSNAPDSPTVVQLTGTGT